MNRYIYKYGWFHVPTGKRGVTLFNCEDRRAEFSHHFGGKWPKNSDFFLYVLSFWQCEDYIYYPMELQPFDI